MKKMLFLLCFLPLTSIFIMKVAAQQPVPYSEMTNEELFDAYLPAPQDCIYSEFEDAYFDIDSDINIDFSVISQYSHQEYYVEYDSGEIKLDVKQVRIQNNQFGISFSIKDAGEYSIRIVAHNSLFSHEYNLYVYATMSKVFVSHISPTQARRIYFEYLNSQNLADDSTYNEIVFGIEPQTNIYDFIVEDSQSIEDEALAAMSGTVLCVTGTVIFQDFINHYHPARDVKVILKHNMQGLWLMYDSTYTDSSGHYQLCLATPIQNFEIKVSFQLSNDNTQIQDNIQIYSYEYGPFPAVSTTYYINHHFDYASEMGKAANFYEAALLGFEYLDLVDSENIEDYPFLGIEYPSSISSLSWYFPGISEIYLTSGAADEWAWDTVLHEFGHYIADVNSFSYFWPALHSMDMNLIDEFGKSIGTELAWSEGIAHYFCNTIQDATNSALLNIPNVGDRYEGDKSMETICDPTWLKGEGSEYVIGLLLYDLTDPNDDLYDTFCIDYSSFFSMLESMVASLQAINPEDRLWNFTQFYTLLSPYMDYLQLGDFMSYFKIAALPNTMTVSYEVPRFSWVEQGGTTTYVNNSFVLYIMNSSKQIILDPINVIDDNEVSLSEEQWNVVLASGTSKIWWYVNASETTGYETGPYFSGDFSALMPTQTSLQLNQGVFGRLRLPGQYIWLKFTAPSAETYYFYSTGTTDTYAEFFNHPVAGTSTYGLVAYDNDSGSGTNFSEGLQLSLGQTIYLRVRGNNWTSTGSFTVYVWSN